MVLIYNPEFDEERLKLEIENTGKVVTGWGGTLREPEQWGKRRLAYPIKGSLEGYYVSLTFTAKPSVTKELVAGLRISENVLRYMLVKL